MQMASCQRTLREMQPVIEPTISALRSGIRYANERHAGPQGLRRAKDQHYWTHTVRRKACDELVDRGLYASLDEGDRRETLSGILIQYGSVWLRVLRPTIDRKGRALVPVPGRSDRKQAFYRQEPVLEGLECVASNNILALWQDRNDELVEPLLLVRPAGGDHRRRNLRVAWEGPLRSDMAHMRAADLDTLRPTYLNWELGDEAT